MSFDTSWEKLYRDKEQMSAWPWSDLIGYVLRYCDLKKPDFRVLELGCGSGANIPFFRSAGVEYWAIEGSGTIVEYLHKANPDLTDHIKVGDFTESLPFPGNFDLVVDRGSLTHNPSKSIAQALDLIYSVLHDDGKFVGIGWFSTDCTAYRMGVPTDDVYTRTQFTGLFQGTGNVHFADKAHLMDLLSRYHLEILEHKILKREIPQDDSVVASWNLVATKRSQNPSRKS